MYDKLQTKKCTYCCFVILESIISTGTYTQSPCHMTYLHIYYMCVFVRARACVCLLPRDILIHILHVCVCYHVTYIYYMGVLSGQLMSKKLSTASETELEMRLHHLTENLIQKQTLVESLSTEKNSLKLQLERSGQQCKDMEQAAARSSSNVRYRG